MRKTSAYARRRSHPRRRAGYVDAMGSLRLLRELEPFTADEIATLTLPPQLAYEAISTGRSQPGDFDTLAAVVNVSLMRAERLEQFGYGRPDATPDELEEELATGRQAVALCLEAQDVLMHMGERHRRTGRWGVDAQARETIPAVLDLHHQLLLGSTPKQMKEALLEVLRRCRSGQVHRVETVEGVA